MPQQSSPLLDQYNADGIMTPALQRALDRVKQQLGTQYQLTRPSSPEATTPRQLAPVGTAPVPSISRDVNSTGLVSPGGMTPAPAPAPAPTATPKIADPDASAHLTERDRLIKTGSGISQVKNPVARGLLRAADIAGSAFFPAITAGIPGTEFHHNYLVKRAEGTVDKDVSMAKENAGTANLEAETQKNLLGHIPTNELELWAQQNPGKSVDDFLKLKRENAPERNETPFDVWRKQNPNGTAEEWLKTEEGAKYHAQQENTHVLPDGTVIAVHTDPATGKSTAEVVYQGKPNEKPGHVIQRNVNGKLHNILVDAETGADRVDLGEGRQPTPADHGTTVIGPDNKVLRLEPGQTAPAGFTTPQQGGAANATEAKGAKAVNEAVTFGREYIKSGQFTGPKDEALLEAFFEVAKPSTGFRMTQPQIDMLMNARSWMESAKGIAYHAETGTWFPPEQRKQIVEAMEARAASKGGGAQVPTITTQAEYDKLPKGAEYIEGGQKYRKP